MKRAASQSMSPRKVRVVEKLVGEVSLVASKPFLTLIVCTVDLRDDLAPSASSSNLLLPPAHSISEVVAHSCDATGVLFAVLVVH